MTRRNNFGKLRIVLGVAAVSLLGFTYAGVAIGHNDETVSTASPTPIAENINQNAPTATVAPPAVKSLPASSLQRPRVATVPRVHARTRAS